MSGKVLCMSRPIAPPARTLLRWQFSPCEQVEFVQACMGVCGLAGHFHDVWSVGLILAGACRFTTGGVEHVAPTGSVFILPPYEWHVCGAADQDVRYAVLYVEVAVMCQQAPRLAAGVGHLRQRVWRAQPGMQSLFDAAAHLRHMSAACDWLAALDQVLQATLPPRPSAPASHEALHPLQQHFHVHWAAPLDLAEEESRLTHSRWHTIRTFHRATGLAPGVYLRQLRVQKSRHWLADPGCSLADIALQLGFADQAHFTRVFKQFYGVTPGRLRTLLMRSALDSQPERGH
jgi:AraC-like DNA-binding protein